MLPAGIHTGWGGASGGAGSKARMTDPDRIVEMCAATCRLQRRTCGLTGLSLLTCCYDAQRPFLDAHFSERITELALERRRWVNCASAAIASGKPQRQSQAGILHLPPWRTERITQKTPKRCVDRTVFACATGGTEPRLVNGFCHDALATGHRIKCQTCVDDFKGVTYNYFRAGHAYSEQHPAVSRLSGDNKHWWKTRTDLPHNGSTALKQGARQRLTHPGNPNHNGFTESLSSLVRYVRQNERWLRDIVRPGKPLMTDTRITMSVVLIHRWITRLQLFLKPAGEPENMKNTNRHYQLKVVSEVWNRQDEMINNNETIFCTLKYIAKKEEQAMYFSYSWLFGRINNKLTMFANERRASRVADKDM